jgi:hypothetical protein
MAVLAASMLPYTVVSPVTAVMIHTPKGDTVTSSAPDWAALQDTIAGDVVLPESPDYEAVRKPFIARFDHVRPQAIVRCRTPTDVA